METTSERNKIDDLLEQWEAAGRRILNEIEVEHDVRMNRIDQLRRDILREKEAMTDLRVRRKTICARLGVDPGEDRPEVDPVERTNGAPANGVVRRPSRREERESALANAEVEHYRPNRASTGQKLPDPSTPDEQPRAIFVAGTIRGDILATVREHGPMFGKDIAVRVSAMLSGRKPEVVLPEVSKLKSDGFLVSARAPNSRAHLYSIP